MASARQGALGRRRRQNGFSRLFTIAATPRSVLVRGQDRFHHLRYRPRHALLGFALTTSFLGWTAYSVHGFLTHRSEIATREAQIAELRQQNEEFRLALTDQRGAFAAMAVELESQDDLLARNQALAAQLYGLRREAGTLRAERDAAVLDRLAALDALSHAERSATEARKFAHEAGQRLDAKQRELERFSVALERAEKRAARAEIRIERFQQVVVRLQKNGEDLTQRLGAANRQIASLTQARDEAQAERGRIAEELATVEQSLAALRETHSVVLDRIAAHADLRVAALETTLGDLGIDAAALGSEPADENGVGGPFVASLADYPIDDSTRPLWDRVLMLDGRVARMDELAQVMTTLPLSPPVEDLRRTSDFGRRKDPKTGKAAFHEGLDFGGPSGTSVKAGAGGKVVHAGWKGAYGRLVEIDHGNGITTRYAHLSKVLVKKGDEVAGGAEIGKIGSSGRSTGPHLHYEVRFKGKALDPENFLKVGGDVCKG